VEEEEDKEEEESLRVEELKEREAEWSGGKKGEWYWGLRRSRRELSQGPIFNG